MPSEVDPSNHTVTVLAGSAAPDTTSGFSVTCVMTGAAGAIESTVTAHGSDDGPLLLEASVAVAVKRVMPWGNVVPV